MLKCFASKKVSEFLHLAVNFVRDSTSLMFFFFAGLHLVFEKKGAKISSQQKTKAKKKAGKQILCRKQNTYIYHATAASLSYTHI